MIFWKLKIEKIEKTGLYALLPDLTFYRHFNDFQLQEYHIDDLCSHFDDFLEIKNLHYMALKATLSFVFTSQLFLLEI